jgi:hypothetical protein
MKAFIIILTLIYLIMTLGYTYRLYSLIKNNQYVKTENWVDLIGLTGGWIVIIMCLVLVYA